MLVSNLKKELISLTNRNDDEECESDEKAYEAINNNINMVNEKHNMEKMKRGYEGRSIMQQN